MTRLFTLSLCCLVLLATNSSFAQSAQYPIVKGYGGIYEVPDAIERPDPDGVYKIVVDMSTGGEENSEISRWVNNVARMVNLHGLAGVPKENIKVKVVVHGGAIFTVLNNEAYKKQFNVDNPNMPVYKALVDAGVEVLVCGQSMHARNFQKSDLYEGVDVALSALTTVTTYAAQGYTVLKF